MEVRGTRLRVRGAKGEPPRAVAREHAEAARIEQVDARVRDLIYKHGEEERLRTKGDRYQTARTTGVYGA